MAHRRSSIKKIRIDRRRKERNVRVRSELKTAARNFERLIAEKKRDQAAPSLRILISELDIAVKKGVIHKNVANRRKSRLSRRLNALKSA